MIMWLLRLFLWIGALWGLAAQSNNTNTTAHEAMLEKVKYPLYDASMRPNFGKGPVEVEIDVVMNAVGPVNDREMMWTTSFFFRQEWTDPRLILEGTDTIVRFDGDYVGAFWVPDVFFANSKTGKKHVITVPNHLVYINSSTGRILSSQRLTMVLNCEMNLVKFPHDEQECAMKMESYSYTTNDLTLMWSSKRSATDLQPGVYLPDYKITNIYTDDCSVTYATGEFPCLQAAVHLKREIGFYIFGTYLPSILIVILSWASFWIDHEAVPARISVGLLTVLTITTQLSGSRAELPRVPYIKAIDVWMSTNLVFVFAAYMEYAVVTVLSRRYKKAKAAKAHRKEEDKMLSEIQIVIKPDPTPSSSQTNDPPTPANESAPSPSSEDTGRRVDKASRYLFPLVYIIFNIAYWVYYVVL